MGAGAVVDAGSGGFALLVDPSRTWYNNTRIILLNTWIFLLLITSATNGYDGSMMNGLQSVEQWAAYFGFPHGSQLGLLNAIQTIGGLAGLPFAPYLSDGIGRRCTIFLGASIMCAATGLQTASQNVAMFMAARFLIGFGCSFAANAAPMLITEISYPPYRAPLTSMYNTLWYLGAIIAAWTTFGTFQIPSTWSWRIPSLLQGLPSVFQIIFIWFAPESPRWLLMKGRDMQALETLAYYHADGNDMDALVQHEFNEMVKAAEADKKDESKSSWGALLATPGNRKRMLLIVAIAWFSQWSGNGLVSYYLTEVFDSVGITDPTTQLTINGCLHIWNLFWATGAAFCVDKAGRRVLFLTSAIGMFLFFGSQTICSAMFAENKDDNSAHGVIVFIFLFYAAYDLAFTPLIVSYTVEILPFSLRAKGLTIFNLVIAVALIFNQYVNPVALEKLGWKYYIVYVAFLAFEVGFLYCGIVETKNKSLEETAALFDGQIDVPEVSLDKFVLSGSEESLPDVKEGMPRARTPSDSGSFHKIEV